MNEKSNKHEALQMTWENYVSSWKRTPLEEKFALFASALSPDCVYTDPLIQAKGWEELSSYMLDFHKQLPGGYFVTTYYHTHHNKSIARWKMMNGEDIEIGEGISYGEYDEQGKLLSVNGFFET